MKRNTLAGHAGFTLVELMIVVVIIGILAAIAIPQFQKFQMRSRHAEVPQVIGAVHAAQEGWAARWVHYAEFSGQPNPAPIGTERAAWEACGPGLKGDGHCLTGFSPQGRTSFQFSVGAGDTFTAPAWPAVANDATLGSDAEGFPSAKPTDGAIGTVAARPALIDVTIAARGDMDANGIDCLFVATDETRDPKPFPIGCGENEF